jgi:integrase
MTRQRGLGSTYLKRSTWWISYYVNGEQQRESSKSSNRADATRLLRQKIGEIAQGKAVGNAVNKTTFDDLAQMIIDDYTASKRSSTERVGIAMNNLREYYGGQTRAAKITSDRVTAYVTHRQKQGMANATICNELANLKRAFNLALDAGKVAIVPKIKKPHVDNARSGFFEYEEYQAVLKELPDYLKPMIQLAYASGWRVQSELLTRKWLHVDFKNGWLRLDPGESKNDEARNFPLSAELLALLQRQRAWVSERERAYHKIIPTVFCMPDGKPIGLGYRYAWKQAFARAGYPDKVMHDFRRTAVRNLERAGVSRSVAMKFTGHKTESVYKRYAIVSESDLREGAVKLALLHASDAAAN